MNETIRVRREELQPAPASTINKNDRFSSVLVVLITIGAIILGLSLKQQSVNETWGYVSREAGIEAFYPSGWLTDESGSYVVRIRDPKARPFKTQFMITIVPAGGSTSVRNVLDNLTLQRAADLSAYRVLDVHEIPGIDPPLTEMNFAFVDADPNPFVQRLPVVVLGRDIVILDGNRAIIVTFMADQDSFDEMLPVFQRFLVSLQY